MRALRATPLRATPAWRLLAAVGRAPHTATVDSVRQLPGAGSGARLTNQATFPRIPKRPGVPGTATRLTITDAIVSTSMTKST
jgi:hypothetical protein